MSFPVYVPEWLYDAGLTEGLPMSGFAKMPPLPRYWPQPEPTATAEGVRKALETLNKQ